MTGRPSAYTTKQGKAILAYLMQHGGEHLAAAQIAAHFSQGEVCIGRTTVFRQLDKMVRQGKLRKYLLNGNTGACYQYVGEGCGNAAHFHLKCEECGRMIHMDGETLPLAAKGILQKYNFEVDAAKTVIYGKCRGCCGKQYI
ncbi:MAG: transcriptional repressor [Oscillospiraceae bacterium]|nr:transcriptional repressor [Oscillospiraceae bacterium]